MVQLAAVWPPGPPHIANALDDCFYELEHLFGEEGSPLAAESHSAAIDFIEQTVEDESIESVWFPLRTRGVTLLSKAHKVQSAKSKEECVMVRNRRDNARASKNN
jgi:hypothetical protein